MFKRAVSAALFCVINNLDRLLELLYKKTKQKRLTFFEVKLNAVLFIFDNIDVFSRE